MSESLEMLYPSAIKTISSFEDLNLNEALLRGMYTYGLDTPSLLQKKLMKPLLECRNILVQSCSGSGKSTGYAIGILEMVDTSLKECQVLVLTPQRVLAYQINTMILNIGRNQRIISYSLMGGTQVRDDIRRLAEGVHILVGTPGRVLDMIKRKFLSLRFLKIFILDEADEAFSRGFAEQTQEIANLIPRNTQCCIFSCTLPEEIMKFVSEFIIEPVQIIENYIEPTVSGVSQYYVTIERDEEKFSILKDLCKTLDRMKCIVFVSTIGRAKALFEELVKNDISASYIENMLDIYAKPKEFGNSDMRVLVSTTIARNPHFPSLMINYDMPRYCQEYLIRIGRSGCFSEKGVAISFIKPGEICFVYNIKNYFSTDILELPDDIRLLF